LARNDTLREPTLVLGPAVNPIDGAPVAKAVSRLNLRGTKRYLLLTNLGVIEP